MPDAVETHTKKILSKVKSAFTSRLSNLGRYDYVVLAAVVAYGVVFSFFTLLKNFDFASYSDLGVFGQAFHTTVFDHKLFFNTLEQYLVPSGNYLGVHFSPILLMLLPVYVFYPSPESLLVSQSFLLALAAVPLYKLSASMLKSKEFGCVIAVSYLLYSPLQGANWFDFHPQLFIPLMIFSTYYFWTKRSWIPYFVCIVLSLMIEEHLVYIVFLLGLCFLVSGSLHHASQRVAPNAQVAGTTTGSRLKLAISKVLSFRNPDQTSAPFWTIVLCVFWYFFTAFIKSLYPVNPLLLNVYQATSTFSALGFKQNILFLPIFMVLNPANVYNALMFDFPTKFLYAVILFAPLLFTPFRSKISLITVVVLGSMLLTNYLPYYTIGAQYPLYVIPLVFIAAVEGLSHLDTRSLASISKNIIIVSLIFAICTSPLSPVTYTFSGAGFFWLPSPPQFNPPAFVGSLHVLISYVPPNASILTQNFIFQHVCSRMNAFLVPLYIPLLNETANLEFMRSYVTRLMERSEYVLLDLRASDYWSEYILSEIPALSFNPYAVTYSFMLFKKGFTAKPVLVPGLDDEVFNAKTDLGIDSGQMISDASSISGEVALSQKGLDEGVLTYGPYIALPSGTFKAVFRIKTYETSPNATVTFDVCTGFGSVSLSRMTLGSSEINDGSWFNVTLPFSLGALTSNIEFRASSNSMTNLYVDSVTVQYS
jgi:uncharacterized membrane protein